MESLNQLEESERKLRKTIIQAPVSIGIFRGENFVTEIANARALELWGRTEEQVLNKPILDAMPELRAQGIQEILDEVYKTGKTFSASELAVDIMRNGQLEIVYVNFNYEATHNLNGEIDGVMAVGFGSLWVASCEQKTVYRINLKSGIIESVIHTGLADEEGELSIAVGAGSVWVLTNNKGELSRINPESNKIISRIAVLPNGFLTRNA